MCHDGRTSFAHNAMSHWHVFHKTQCSLSLCLKAFTYHQRETCHINVQYITQSVSHNNFLLKYTRISVDSPFKACQEFYVPTGLTLKKFYMLITFHLCVLRTNSDLCHLHHKLIVFYNRGGMCLQRGTD